MVGYAGFNGTVGGERHSFRPGLLPLQAGRLQARVPPQHEQQLLGRRLQRRRPALRLDRQRHPSVHLPIPNRYYERVRGWSSSVLGMIAVIEQGRSDHAKTCGRSITTAASPPAPGTPSTPPAAIRRNTGTAPRSSASRPASSWRRSRSTRTAPATARTTVGTSSPATTNGPRRSWPRSAPTAASGSSTGTTSSSSTTPRRAASRPAKAPPTRPRSATRSTGRIYRVVPVKGAEPPKVDLEERHARPTRRDAQERQPLLAPTCPTAAHRTRQQGRRAGAASVGERPSAKDEIDLNPAAIHALWTITGLQRLGRRPPRLLCEHAE